MGNDPYNLERNPDGTPKGWPCCDRTFPDPDPMYRFIHRDEIPDSFYDMPENERSRRLRCYLVCIATGELPLPSWIASLAFDERSITRIHDLVDVINRDDRKIEAMLADRARIRRTLEVERGA